MLSKEEIENKLEQTEDDEITINLLYQEVDLLETKIEQLETNNKNLIKYIEKKMSEYDETIIELVLQNVLAVAKGEKE